MLLTTPSALFPSQNQIIPNRGIVNLAVVIMIYIQEAKDTKSI